MAGIAGITLPTHQQQAVQVLEQLTQRGRDRVKLLKNHEVVTLAI